MVVVMSGSSPSVEGAAGVVALRSVAAAREVAARVDQQGVDVFGVEPVVSGVGAVVVVGGGAQGGDDRLGGLVVAVVPLERVDGFGGPLVAIRADDALDDQV